MTTRRVVTTLLATLLAATTTLSGCWAGTTKAGRPLPAAGTGSGSVGTVRLRFASGESQPWDLDFSRTLASLSGGRVSVEVVRYDGRDPGVDVTIVRDLRAGRLDVADVASRAWKGQGLDSFAPFQAPFLVTSRAVLDAAVRDPVSGPALASLGGLGLTGLAMVPRGVRYVFSTRPLRSVQDFAGAVVRTNADPLAENVLRALGARQDDRTATGSPTVEALRSGRLTGVEADVQSAVVNGYPAVAPYVLTGAPLYAKTTTFVASSSRLRSWGTQVAGWVREAARTAAAGASAALHDQALWAGACAGGLRPVAVTEPELDRMRAAQEGVYRAIGAAPGPTLTFARIGKLAASLPRDDPWTTCAPPVPRASRTAALDGVWTAHVTPQEVEAGGDCTVCGNDGDYRITVRDGRYAIEHPTPPDADPNEPTIAFLRSWRPDDAIDVGTMVVDRGEVLVRPDIGLQAVGAEITARYTFTEFRGSLRWKGLSGATWTAYTAEPWHRAG